jgi:hypothetical protein
MANGLSMVGGNFRLQIDGSTAVAVKNFNWANEKPTYEITSLDSSGTREYISSKLKGSSIEFSAGIVRPGSHTNGKSFDELLNQFYTTDTSIGWVIVPDVSGYKWAGAGFLTNLNPEFTNYGDGELTYSGTIQVTGNVTRTAV